MKYPHLTSRPARHLCTALRRLGLEVPRTQGEALERLEAVEVGRAERPGTLDEIAATLERLSKQGRETP